MTSGKDYIKINGVSSDTVDLWIDTPPVPPMPKRRVTVSQTALEEDAFVREKSYENSTLAVSCYSFFPENFDNSDIYDFILGAQTVEISRLPGRYYKVVNVTAAQPVASHDGNRIKYNITFTVLPFKYNTENSYIAMEINTIDITNNGNFFARPQISFKATGDVVIDCNGDFFYIYNIPADSDVIIDSERLTTLIGTEIVNASTNGKYPLLAVGNNRITVAGTLSGVKIIKNERWV